MRRERRNISIWNRREEEELGDDDDDGERT